MGRVFGSDPRPNALMSVPFLVLSVLWGRLLGLAHVATGLWLMYLTVAAVLNMARGFNLPL
jgi:hypothetical protein